MSVTFTKAPLTRRKLLVLLGALCLMSSVVLLKADWLPNPAAGQFNFQETIVPVYEGEDYVTLTIERNGGSLGNVTVNYTTENGTAVGGWPYSPGDFTHYSQVLSWTDGDSAPKTINIPIINDSIEEDDEFFTVKLGYTSNGSTLGPKHVAKVIIIDRHESHVPSYLIPRTLTNLLPGLKFLNGYLDVSGIGDIDGDGQDDIAIGDMYEEFFPALDDFDNEIDGSSCPQGLAYVLNNLPTLSQTIDVKSPEVAQFTPSNDAMAFSSHITGLGDINGDGVSDYAIGSLNVYNPYPEALIVLGSSAGVTSSPQLGSTVTSFTLEVEEEANIRESRLTNISYLGDLNGDGFSDFSVSTDLFYDSETRPVTYIVYGQATFPSVLDLDDAPGVVDKIVGSESEWRLALRSIGDFNGDGYDDLLFTSNLQTVIMYGDGQKIPIDDNAIDLTQINYSQTFDCTPVGDINGDGYYDLATILSASEEESSSTLGVILGHENPASIIDYNDFNENHGLRVVALGGATALRAIGDFNGDGFGDIALERDNPYSESAQSTIPIELIFGSEQGVGKTISVDSNGVVNLLESSRENHSLITQLPWFLGKSIHGGDINMDGASDLLIGGSPGLGGSGYPCFVEDNGISSLMIFGFPTKTERQYTVYLPSGNTGKRPVGFLPDGTHSIPFSGVWAAFIGGDSSRVSVMKSANVNDLTNIPDNALPYYWRIDNNRQGHSAERYTFQYYDADIAIGDEDRLAILHSTTVDGPWTIGNVISHDKDKNQITVETSAGAPHQYFILVPLNRVFERGTMTLLDYPGKVGVDISSVDRSFCPWNTSFPSITDSMIHVQQSSNIGATGTVKVTRSLWSMGATLCGPLSKGCQVTKYETYPVDTRGIYPVYFEGMDDPWLSLACSSTIDPNPASNKKLLAGQLAASYIHVFVMGVFDWEVPSIIPLSSSDPSVNISYYVGDYLANLKSNEMKMVLYKKSNPSQTRVFTSNVLENEFTWDGLINGQYLSSRSDLGVRIEATFVNTYNGQSSDEVTFTWDYDEWIASPTAGIDFELYTPLEQGDAL